MPFIKEKFTTYDAFAKADMKDVYGEEKLSQALHLQAKTFKSVYLENRGEEGWKEGEEEEPQLIIKGKGEGGEEEERGWWWRWEENSGGGWRKGKWRGEGVVGEEDRVEGMEEEWKG